MNLLQSCKSILKTVVITLATCLFLFSPVAIASTDNPSSFKEQVSVKNGKFSITDTGVIPSATIQEAIISLPAGESGTIDSIEIIGPNNNREFGCQKIDVVNGTDLIKSCVGVGPLSLEEGKTIYKASGSNFKPDPNTSLKITLS